MLEFLLGFLACFILMVAVGIVVYVLRIYMVYSTRDEKILTTFIHALVRAQESEPSVLCLLCNRKTAVFAGLVPSPGEKFVRFVLRNEYDALWKRLYAKYKAGVGQVIVVGTSGIGKSMFRYYIIREWVLNRIPADFDEILLNVNKEFFVINRHGEARRIAETRITRVGTFALLDPCELLNGEQNLGFDFLIVTTSPSPLVGQSTGYSLTQLTKFATVYPMKSWIRDEVQQGMPNVNPKRLEMFSYKTMEGVEYFVPRWLNYSDDEIEFRLSESLTTQSRDGLVMWFQNNRDAKCNDFRLPYRLCVVGEGTNRWTAVGFISDFVGLRALEWALSGVAADRRIFLDLLQNPWSRGLVGNIFEQWVFEGLAHGKMLKLKLNVSMNTLSSIRVPDETVQFSEGISYFEWNKVKSDIDILIKSNVLYKATVRNFASIAGYGRVGNRLFLIQTTVSPEHSPAQWDHVTHIVSRAKRELERCDKLIIYLVYLVPKDTEFIIPTCPTFRNKPGFICTGEIVDDDFDSNFLDPELLRKSVRYEATER